MKARASKLREIEFEIQITQRRLTELRRAARMHRILQGSAVGEDKRQGLRYHLCKVMAERPRGASVTELLLLLKDRGCELKARRPDLTIYTTMRRHPELFRQIDRGTWGLKKRA